MSLILMLIFIILVFVVVIVTKMSKSKVEPKPKTRLTNLNKNAMKQVSLWQRIFLQLRNVLEKYPVATISVVILCVLGFYIIYRNVHSGIDEYTRAIMTLITLFLLSTSGEIFSYLRNYSIKNRLLTQLGVIIFVGIYAWLLPGDFSQLPFDFTMAHTMWYLCFIISLFIAGNIFYREIKNNDIYVQSALILRAIAAGCLFAVVSFGLGVLLLWALGALFGLSVEDGFGYWWVVSATLIGPILTLSQLPLSAKHNITTRLPKLLNIFISYIVIPFVILYFIILYTYTGKILFLWQWPEGVVSWMIIIFSIIGWSAYFTLFPWRENNSLLTFYNKLFPWIALPQIAMLFIALWWRVAAYGITINRYFVALLGVWLLINAIYYGLSRKKNLRVGLYTFFILTLLASFGSWGVFDVSKRSQGERLLIELQENNLINANGEIIKNSNPSIDQGEQNNIVSILEYIDKNHGIECLEEMLPGVITEVRLNRDCNDRCSIYDIQAELNIEYSYDYQRNKQDGYIRYSYMQLEVTSERRVFDVKDYDYIIPDVYMYGYERHSEENLLSQFDIDGNKYVLQYYDSKLQLVFKNNKKLIVDVKDLLKKAKDIDNNQKFVEQYSNEEMEMKLIIQNISGNIGGEEIKVDSLGTTIMIKVK